MRPAGTASSGWSVWTQLAAIVAGVAVVAVLILGAGAWLAVVSLRDAENDAHAEVTFQAGLATDAVADALTLGCRTAQGYLFAKTQPADQLTTPLGTGLPDELRRAVRTHNDRAWA